jgi:hypothetical protein
MGREEGDMGERMMGLEVFVGIKTRLFDLEETTRLSAYETTNYSALISSRPRLILSRLILTIRTSQQLQRSQELTNTTL